MGAAFLTPGQALIDAVAIRLVGNDEDAAVGGSARGGKQEGAGKECWGKSHGGHRQGRKPPSGISPNG